MDERTSRMVFTTAALAAVAAVLVGPAGAYIPEGNGVQPVSGQSEAREIESAGPVVVPYLSHGIGVDKARFSGTPSRTVAGGQALGQLDMAIRTAITARASQATQLDTQTIPYLSQGVGVDSSQFSGQAAPRLTGVHAALARNQYESSPVGPVSLGLTGDSPLGRVVAHEPEGLTGDTASTRVPEAAPAPTVSSGDDIEWTSFGAGAGMVALVAAGLVGILLTVRRRHTVGLP